MSPFDYGSSEWREVNAPTLAERCPSPTAWDVAMEILPPAHHLATLRTAVQAKHELAPPAWTRLTAYHIADDAHVTLAGVWHSRRAFEAAGWTVRIVSNPACRDELVVEGQRREASDPHDDPPAADPLARYRAAHDLDACDDEAAA